MKRPYKKPDLHAPRNRNIPPDYLAYPKEDRHGYFTRLKQQYPHMAKYSNSQIAGWIEDYNKQMAHEIVTNPKGLILPEGLGFIVVTARVIPKGIANNNIDFAASNKAGVVVTHNNYHSAQYVADIKYTNNIRRYKFTNHQYWTFKPIRALKRAVSSEFKRGQIFKYLLYTKWHRISDIFHKHKAPRPDWRAIKRENFLKTYDEFAFD